MATITFEAIYTLDTAAAGNVTAEVGAAFRTYEVDDGVATDPNTLTFGDTVTITQSGTGNSFTATFAGTSDDTGEPIFAGVTGSTIAAIPDGSVVFLSDTAGLPGPIPTTLGGSFEVCFAAGTLIATPEGERVVEALEIGDVVTTADGRAVKVKWIGRQTMLRMFRGERAIPVRVTAGALGGGLPHTDLVLTADHALILDGLAINAGALVNGATIVWDHDVADRATYYHVETEEHDVILANGAASETYVDYISRKAFDNYAEYVELYGDERTIREMDMPRVSAARLLPPALKARLAGIKAA